MSNTSIRISSGKLVDLADFKPEDICLESITKSLNSIKRFTGHWKHKEPLTVAQHTMLTFQIATELYPKDFPVHLGCLLHDMPEAYYGDFSSPLKRFMEKDYRKYMEGIDRTLWASLWFLEPYTLTDFVQYKVKQCDIISLRIEQAILWGEDSYLTELPEDQYKFVMKQPVDKWFDYLSEQYCDLEGAYNEMKQTYMGSPWNNPSDEAVA